MMNNATKYNLLISKTAIDFLRTYNGTLDSLYQMREAELQRGSTEDQLDQMYYSVIQTAIDMMERPLFD